MRTFERIFIRNFIRIFMGIFGRRYSSEKMHFFSKKIKFKTLSSCAELESRFTNNILLLLLLLLLLFMLLFKNNFQKFFKR